MSAAKRCLLEKGYTQTTARDIASAAGVSLAAIGYHFRSKEALLTEAMMLAFDDWNCHFANTLRDLPPGTDQARRFEAIWNRLIPTFETHRSLWRANYEIFSQIQTRPEIREVLGASVSRVRHMLASLFLGIPQEQITSEIADSVGAFHHVLLSGMIGQWLIDAEHGLSAPELTKTLAQVGSAMQPAEKSKARSASSPHAKIKRA